jgi:hypothetical protein
VVRELQPSGASWRSRIAGTFQATVPGRDGAPTIFVIEDGTATLDCVMADASQRTLFGGATRLSEPGYGSGFGFSLFHICTFQP